MHFGSRIECLVRFKLQEKSFRKIIPKKHPNSFKPEKGVETPTHLLRVGVSHRGGGEGKNVQKAAKENYRKSALRGTPKREQGTPKREQGTHPSPHGEGVSDNSKKKQHEMHSSMNFQVSEKRILIVMIFCPCFRKNIYRNTDDVG